MEMRKIKQTHEMNTDEINAEATGQEFKTRRRRRSSNFLTARERNQPARNRKWTPPQNKTRDRYTPESHSTTQRQSMELKKNNKTKPLCKKEDEK